MVDRLSVKAGYMTLYSGNGCFRRVDQNTANGRLFRKLVEESEPTIVAVQETFLKTNSKHITIPGYTAIRKDKTSITNGSINGLALFIDTRLTSQELNLNF